MQIVLFKFASVERFDMWLIEWQSKSSFYKFQCGQSTLLLDYRTIPIGFFSLRKRKYLKLFKYINILSIKLLK